MPKVNVVDRDGRGHELEAEDELPLMFSLRDSGLPVEGTCGGTAGCGTCHVYVDAAWYDRLPPKQAAESDMLEALESFDPTSSRLSCQIEMVCDLDGLVVTLAPVEFI